MRDTIVCDLTKVPNDLKDPRATAPSPGSWRPRISPVATRWMVARVAGRSCPWSCTPRGHRSEHPPRCHPLYFRSRLGCPCRAAHCSLRKKKKKGSGLMRNARSYISFDSYAATGKVEPRLFLPLSFFSLPGRRRNVCNFRWKNLYVYFCGDSARGVKRTHGFIDLSAGL